MVPLVMCPFCSNIPVKVLVKTDLPEPDSPTMASVSCSLISKETLRIAFNSRLRTVKPTERFSTDNTVSFSMISLLITYVSVDRQHPPRFGRRYTMIPTQGPKRQQGSKTDTDSYSYLQCILKSISLEKEHWH